MTLTRERLAEKAAAVERHLRRVADRLPSREEPFESGTDASDAVILHLWQATQLVIDLALSVALTTTGNAPPTYADAFVVLRRAGIIPEDLARRLVRATGFRNVLVHAPFATRSPRGPAPELTGPDPVVCAHLPYIGGGRTTRVAPADPRPVSPDGCPCRAGAGRCSRWNAPHPRTNHR